MNWIIILATGLLLAAGPASAQTTVYKCKTSHGTVYSGQPCAGADGTQETLHLPKGPEPGQADLERLHEARRTLAAERRQDERNAAYRRCINAVTYAARDRTSTKIASNRAAIQRLQSQQVTSPSTYQGQMLVQQWQTNVQTRIARHEAAINSAREVMASTLANARSVCSERRAKARSEDIARASGDGGA